MEQFLHGNEWQWKLARTIIQGIIGVIVANIDMIVGSFAISVEFKPIIVALVMAVLSPVMAQLGANNQKEGDK